MTTKRCEPLTFAVVYFTDALAPVSVDIIQARDYWAACRKVWDGVSGRRRKAMVADFVIVEDPSIIEAGPQHIRPAAVALIAARDAERTARL